MAAERVTSCNARTIASLVSKSLLRMQSDGRYEMRSLLKTFAAEFLDKNEESDISFAHARYFSTMLSQLQSGIAGPKEVEAFHQIEIEIDNLRVAWRWLSAHVLDSCPVKIQDTGGLHTLLEQFIPMLSMFYVRRGWYREAEVVFTRLLQR